MNDVPFRSSFEPTFSLCFAAYVVEMSASLPPLGARKRPFVTCAVVTTPIDGCVWSTPPIVYAVVEMFVCGGFEHLLERLLRRRELRAEAAQAGGQALRERAAVGRRRSRRRPPPPPPPPKPPPPPPPLELPPLLARSLSKQACIACELRGGRARDVALDPERLAAGLQLRDDLRDDAGLVLGEERQARRHLRDVRERVTCFAADLLERQLRARQEEVVHEVRARLAELREVGDHRLVRRDQVAAAAPGRRRSPSGSAAARASRSGRCRCRRADRASSSARGRARSRGSRSRSRARRRARARAA